MYIIAIFLGGGVYRKEEQVSEANLSDQLFIGTSTTTSSHSVALPFC